jgi:hypothetical protein
LPIPRTFVSIQTMTPEDILKRALGSDRFAFDYSKSWRFLALTPEEHKALLKHFDLPSPVAAVKPRRNKDTEG